MTGGGGPRANPTKESSELYLAPLLWNDWGLSAYENCINKMVA